METEIKRDSVGRFLKGSAPNPLGRPKSDKTIRDLARVHTKDALKTLHSIVKNPKASDTARVQACNALLDRGWGKAPQYVEKLNLGMSYEDYLEEIARRENEEIKSVDVNYTVDDL